MSENNQIAAAMRAGSARYWPDESHQAKYGWYGSPNRRCYAQMLADSLETSTESTAFKTAARAILQAAGIAPAVTNPFGSIVLYLIALNEGRDVFELSPEASFRSELSTEWRVLEESGQGNLHIHGRRIEARPFDELKMLIEKAADLLESEEQAPLPMVLTELLVVNKMIEEKELV